MTRSSRVWFCPKHGSVCREGDERSLRKHRQFIGCFRILELREDILRFKLPLEAQ